MKKAVLIIGGIVVVAGVGFLAVRRYYRGPKVTVSSVNWDTNTAQLLIGSQAVTLKSGMAVPIGHAGMVVAFSPDNSSIVQTSLSAPNAVFGIYDTKPATYSSPS